MTTAYDDFIESFKGKYYVRKSNPDMIPFEIVGYQFYGDSFIIRSYSRKDTKESIESAGVSNLRLLERVSSEEAERIFQTHQETSSQSSPKRTETEKPREYETPEEAVTAFYNRRPLGDISQVVETTQTPIQNSLEQHSYLMAVEGDLEEDLS